MKWVIVGSRWPEINATASALHTYGVLNIVRKIVGDGTDKIHFISPHRINNHFNTIMSEFNISCSRCQPNTEQFDGFLKVVKPDAVIFDRFIMEEQFSFKLHPSTLKILDTQDLHFLRVARMQYVQENDKIADAPYEINVKDENMLREIASIHRADVVLVVSPFEKELLETKFGISPKKILVAPFWYDKTKQKKEVSTFENRKNFMMIGNYLHPPNFDALKWCSDSLWSQIREVLPDAELHIYGAYTTKEASLLAKREIGLVVRGPEVNLDELFAKYRVNFAPLRFGAGIKGKITDGWYRGVPCLTTPIGSEGLHYRETSPSSWGGIVADNVKAFQQAAVTLYKDQNAWETYQKNGYDLIDNHFELEKNGNELKENLLAALTNKDAIRAENVTGSILTHHFSKSYEYFSKFIEAKEKVRNLKQQLDQLDLQKKE